MQQLELFVLVMGLMCQDGTTAHHALRNRER